MAYLTWDFMAQFVEGEKRLKEEIVRRAETAQTHPFFTQKLAAAERLADQHFERGGYETPIENLTDPLAMNAIAGVLIGLLTETLSNREPWMENAYKAGLAHLKSVGDGDVQLDGAEIDAESGGDNASAEGYRADEAVFDDADPYALGAGVFPPLRAPRGLRGRW